MTKNRRYQIASGWFLADEIPIDYFDWDTRKQDAFLVENVTEDYELMDADALRSRIEAMAGFINWILKNY